MNAFVTRKQQAIDPQQQRDLCTEWRRRTEASPEKGPMEAFIARTEECMDATQHAQISSGQLKHQREETQEQQQQQQQQHQQKRAKTAWPVDLDGLVEYEDRYFHYVPQILTRNESRDLYTDLLQRYEFRRDQIVVGGRTCSIQRTQALLAKQGGVRYRYAGSDFFSEAWSDEMDALCNRLSQQFGAPLNSALVNHYAHGKECVGRHSDDEGDMEHDVIVTVSLGVARLIRLTGKDKASDKRLQCTLREGSVFVQKTGAQRVLKHEIPKQAKIVGGRISITFRQLRMPRTAPTSTSTTSTSTSTTTE